MAIFNKRYLIEASKIKDVSSEDKIKENLSHMYTEEIEFYANNKVVRHIFTYKDGHKNETVNGDTTGEKEDIKDSKLAEKLSKEEYSNRKSGKTKCVKYIKNTWPTKSIPHKSGAIKITRIYAQ